MLLQVVFMYFVADLRCSFLSYLRFCFMFHFMFVETLTVLLSGLYRHSLSWRISSVPAGSLSLPHLSILVGYLWPFNLLHSTFWTFGSQFIFNIRIFLISFVAFLLVSVSYHWVYIVPVDFLSSYPPVYWPILCLLQRCPTPACALCHRLSDYMHSTCPIQGMVSKYPIIPCY